MRNLLYLFTIIFIVSCGKSDERPDHVLPPEQMANILSDIYVAEYKATNVGVKRDSSKIIMRHYELKIFDEYNTTDSIYKESFKYYLEHPQQLENVYDIVIDSLSLREQIKEATPRKR